MTLPATMVLALSSSDVGNVLLPVLGAALGVGGFIRGFKQLQRKRLIANIPVSTVRGSALGLAEISGSATGPYTIPAPLTQQQCFCYRAQLWRYEQRGRDSEWVRIADEKLHVPFYVEDSTGKMLIDPAEAELEMHDDYKGEFHVPLKDALPQNLARFLASYGVRPLQRVKLEETCIKPRDPIFVLGTVAENTGLRPSAVPVGNSDVAGNFDPRGVTSGAAALATPAVLAASANAETTHATAATAVAEPPATSPGAEPVVDDSVVMQKGLLHPEFVVSWRSRKALLKELATMSFVYIWGGPLLTLLSVFVLSVRFGWFK